MVAAYLILAGFRSEIKQKIFDFSGHVHVQAFSTNQAMEEASIADLRKWMELIENPRILSVEPVAYLPAILRLKDGEVEGLVIKGVNVAFDTTRFKKYLEEGRFPKLSGEGYTTEVVISTNQAQRLQLRPGDKVNAFFFQNPPRARPLQVVGVYNTGFEEFDRNTIIGDLGMLQRLNGWSPNEAGLLEIHLRSEEDLPEAFTIIDDFAGFEYYVQDVRRKYLDTFDWLLIITNNVNTFLGLIMFVACFNMAAVLFILIMERKNMIGLLKALGGTNHQIRRIFWLLGGKIVVRGLFLGNAIGLGLCWVQFQFSVIKLDPENYFMNKVPVQWDWGAVLFINLLTLLLVMLALFIPLQRVSRIAPVESIRFD
jgi:lipoprotein-releasing system permease protein